jgi:hypothetical protein
MKGNSRGLIKVIFQYVYAVTEENHKKLVEIASVPVEI